jgi:hypothetical protein
MTWNNLPRGSQRAIVGRFACDVWPIGGGARYSVLDTESGCYVKGGQCASVEWAKEVSAGFARSLLDLT